MTLPLKKSRRTQFNTPKIVEDHVAETTVPQYQPLLDMVEQRNFFPQ
jgi:hypothetical protein